MRIWHDKEEIIKKLSEARSAARDTVPRAGGNDAIEAAMFFAMLHALQEHLAFKDEPVNAIEANGTSEPNVVTEADIASEPVAVSEAEQLSDPVKLTENSYDTTG